MHTGLASAQASGRAARRGPPTCCRLVSDTVLFQRRCTATRRFCSLPTPLVAPYPLPPCNTEGQEAVEGGVNEALVWRLLGAPGAANHAGHTAAVQPGWQAGRLHSRIQLGGLGSEPGGGALGA